MAGIEGNLWLLFDMLHTDCSSKIKWKGEFSEPFPVTKGVRQGGILSAEEYKHYNNPLLDILTNSNIGAHIGTIHRIGCSNPP